MGGESDQSLSVLSALGYSCHNVVTCLYVHSTCAGPTGFVLRNPSASKGAWTHKISEPEFEARCDRKTVSFSRSDILTLGAECLMAGDRQQPEALWA